MKKWLFSEDASFALAITGFVVLIGTIILFLINFGGFTATINSDKLDHFGSFIGGLVGAIWSLASFILLYVSLQQQKEDVKLTNEALRLQIDEFKLQQIELEGTKIELEEQGKTQELQRFETTFFNLLNLYELQISKNILGEHTTKSILQAVAQELVDFEINHIKSFENGSIVFSLREDVKGNLNRSLSQIKEYFKTVKYIVEFILKSKVENKENYLNILYFHFSAEEKRSIEFFIQGDEEFKNIINSANRIVDFFEI